MNMENWDPLEGNLSSELVSATIKRQIKNILKSYTGWYDPLCELIQNALDAVEERKKLEATHEGHIWICINLKDNIISVTDNGIGFKFDQFKNFLAPNVSFKSLDNRGNKGVGATYLGYGFNFLQVGTKTPDFSFLGSLKDGREWVEDEGGIKTRPKIIADGAPIHTVFKTIVQGSTFSLKLVGDFIRPKNLNWFSATTAEQWETILRIKTPLGGVYIDKPCPISSCFLAIIDQQGKLSEREVANCRYIYPHEVISTCTDLKSIKQKQMELINKGLDASKLPASFYRLNGIYNTWTHDQFTSDKGEFADSLKDDERTLAKQYKITCYGFFGYSTEIWDRYNDDVVKLRKNMRILRGGIQLAANSMPQGDVLIIPLTRNIGYQNVTHVLIHFEKAEPDLGRKGFQPELQDLAKHIAIVVVSKFLNWRQHLKAETGAPPDIITEKNIHDWIALQEQHEKDSPLVIKREDLFLPTKQPSLTSEPLNEQDVISLFNQLLAGGVIRGIKVLSTSQHNQYDGICKFCLSKPMENHIYNKHSNPLGIEASNATHEYVGAPLILEYKYGFDALIEDFEKDVKSEKQIQLVIAWEIGNNWHRRYDITPLLHFDNLHHRYFHGGTHLIRSSATGTTVFPAIIMSELINYMNDPDAVQDYQKKTYMS